MAAFTRLTDMDLRRGLEAQAGLFMAEGHLVIERCVALGLHVVSVLTAPRWLGRMGEILTGIDTQVYVADEDVLREITGYRVHRGALAAVARPPVATVEGILGIPGDVLVLEDLVDPTNVGLAVRSAVTQGISSMIISPGCADPLYRRSVKSSMGAVLRCAWARSDDWGTTLDRVRASRRLIALVPDGEEEISQVMREARGSDVALLLGSEGPGVTREARAVSWKRGRIAMADDDDSLNVAAAAAVACYARAQTRTMAE